MGYLQELQRAHKQRQIRLSIRAPEAGPLVIKPKPRIIRFNKFGQRISEPKEMPLPKYPPLPPPPQMPVTNGKLTIGQVVFAVAQAYNLSEKDIKDKNARFRHISRPRQIAMYLARTMCKSSYPVIAQTMGGFDHSSVINGYQVTAERIAADNELAAKVESIKSVLLEANER